MVFKVQDGCQADRGVSDPSACVPFRAATPCTSSTITVHSTHTHERHSTTHMDVTKVPKGTFPYDPSLSASIMTIWSSSPSLSRWEICGLIARRTASITST